MALTYVDAYSFVFLRIAFAAIILFALLTLRKPFSASAIRRPSVWVLGLLNGAALTLQCVGLLFTTASITALLVNLNVLTVAVLSWWMFRELFGTWKQLGICFGVAGAAIISTNGDLSTLTNGLVWGDVLVFAAGLVWAFFVVLQKQILMNREEDAIELSAVVMLISALLLLPLAVFMGNLTTSPISAEGWELVGYTALACSVLPYAMWTLALKSVTATVATVVGMLEIVAAMVLSTFFLAETFTALTVTGALLILFSIFAVTK